MKNLIANKQGEDRYKWATAWENVPSDMFAKRSLKSACASAQCNKG